jgi:hypothetical protein
MSASDSQSATKDRRVNEIVADYLRSIERGELPDRAALLARHGDLANELAAFFADHDRFRRARRLENCSAKAERRIHRHIGVVNREAKKPKVNDGPLVSDPDRAAGPSGSGHRHKVPR